MSDRIQIGQLQIHSVLHDLIANEIAPEPPKEVKPARTHWDMLMERRTRADLEELLEERLALLRASREEEELPRSA